MGNWTYDDSLVTPKDQVRFLLQDTDSNDKLATDEEIQFVIDRWLDVQGSVEYCAAIVAEAIAARYAREASYSADGTSVNLAQIAGQFRELAASLRAQHKNLLVGGSPDVGGISPYEGLYPGVKNFNFGTGVHDDLEAGPQDYGSRDAIELPIENYPGV